MLTIHGIIFISIAIVAAFYFYKRKNKPKSESTCVTDDYIRMAEMCIALVNKTNSSVLFVDRNQKVVFANSRYLDLYDDPSEIIGKENALTEICHITPPVITDIYETINAGHSWHNELRYNTEDGEFWYSVQVHSIDKEKGIIAAVSNDITIQKKLESQDHYKTFHDPITDLPNRSMFYELFPMLAYISRTQSKQYAFILIDIDGFQAINDLLGRATGDDILVEISKRVQKCFFDCDTIFRWSGDEFAVMVEITSPDEVHQMLDNIHAQIAAPLVIADHEIYITVQIGVTIYPRDATEMHTLITYTNLALQQAKNEEDTNQFFFDAEMHKKYLFSKEINSLLHHAIENNEFSLVYQPKIDIKDNRMMGVEALLRWESSKIGKISPGVFIPIAEQSTIIIPITRWVCKEALRQYKKWITEGIGELNIAVNITSMHLAHRDIVKETLDMAKSLDVTPSALEFEITERVLIDSTGTVNANIHKLRHNGIKMAIDDFGTGYSSLAYLSKMPIDLIKIDQSLINGLPDNSSKDIINAIVAIAKSMGIKVIAEGVETTEQIAYLRFVDCDYVQGYYFSRPLSPEILAEKITSGELIV